MLRDRVCLFCLIDLPNLGYALNFDVNLFQFYLIRQEKK